MNGRDIIVIGGSAGGYEALHELVRGLPPALPAAVFAVIHTSEGFPLQFPGLTDARGGLPAAVATDGEAIELGRLYLSPAGANLLVERGRVRVQFSPKEHYYRPSINSLFRSAAHAYGHRVIGIVLSGMLNDGTAGLWEIKRRGGIAVVQDPSEAVRPDMPNAALRSVQVDHCVKVAEMPALLSDLVGARPAPPPLRGPRGAKVLIVEDEAIVARNLEKQLRERGYDVSAAVGSAEDALTAVLDNMPDVVLMDIRLPGGLNGTDAAGILWEQFHVPVVYVTAHANNKTLNMVKMTEPYGYVKKPIDIDAVHAAIQIALDRHDREFKGTRH